MVDFKSLEPKIKKLAEKYNLSLIVLFGSQATGALHSKSDVDIAILGINSLDIIKISSDFSSIFKREDVEVVDLRNASPTLMFCVLRDGKILYEKEKETFLVWKLYAIRIWRETAWLRDLRDKKLIEWTKTV